MQNCDFRKVILFSALISLNIVIWYELLGLGLVLPISLITLFLLIADRKGNGKK